MNVKVLFYLLAILVSFFVMGKLEQRKSRIIKKFGELIRLCFPNSRSMYTYYRRRKATKGELVENEQS